ncbi:MAG: GNAT family N-acetyltransferase [Abitibacteriaceae bacterium]|nr:GNAT family N-acetyltransferase [Abditibacteriaceae bacterium]
MPHQISPQPQIIDVDPQPSVIEPLAPSMPLTVFQTRPYLMAYRRCFGANKTFYRLRNGGGAAFLMSRGRTAKRLEWWGAGIHDIGAAAYDSPQTARELWEQIEDLAQQHQAAQLAQLPANCQLITLAQNSGWQVSEAEACPVLTLPDTWDEYVALLGKNMREQIKRYPKRLEKEFKVEYALAQTEAEVQTALSHLFRLHGKRWRARGQTGVLATPRRQRFHREVCVAFARHGWLRLWTMHCNGQPACVLLNYFYGGKYYFFIGGFEPELMRWSVGTCLFARVFRQAIEEGATEFDFLRGEEEYKYRFGAISRTYKTLAYFQDSPRGRLLRQRIQLETEVMHRVHQKFSAAHRTRN